MEKPRVIKIEGEMGSGYPCWREYYAKNQTDKLFDALEAEIKRLKGECYEYEDRADRLAVIADALASDKVESLVKDDALQKYFAEKDRAEKAEQERDECREENRRLQEAFERAWND